MKPNEIASQWLINLKNYLKILYFVVIDTKITKNSNLVFVVGHGPIQAPTNDYKIRRFFNHPLNTKSRVYNEEPNSTFDFITFTNKSQQ